MPVVEFVNHNRETPLVLQIQPWEAFRIGLGGR
jgi:hypothetical protein